MSRIIELGRDLTIIIVKGGGGLVIHCSAIITFVKRRQSSNSHLLEYTLSLKYTTFRIYTLSNTQAFDMSADGSSPQQPFVPGGAYRGSPVPLSIPSYTMPHVSHDTIILAATHPTHQQSDPRDDGFFISDFYAFNYLLKGLGKSQTWLTKAVSKFLPSEFYPLVIIYLDLEMGYLGLLSISCLVISRKSAP